MRWILSSVLLSIALVASVATAQTAVTDAEARGFFDAGRAAFSDERYADALASFVRSYELSGRPELLYNIATCLDRLDREAEALDHFERFLSQRPDTPERAAVESRIAVLQEHLRRDAARAPEEARAAEERARAAADAVRQAELERERAVALAVEAERAAAEARAAADAGRIAAAEQAAAEARARAAAADDASAVRAAEASRLAETARLAVEAAASLASAAATATAAGASEGADAGPDGGVIAAVVTVLCLAAGGGVTAAVLLTQDPGYEPLSQGDVVVMTLGGRF